MSSKSEMLEVIQGTEPESQYIELAKMKGLKLYVRAWLHQGHVDFRLRVTSPENEYSLADICALWPHIFWSGHSEHHLSLLGTIQFPIALVDQEQFLHYLETSGDSEKFRNTIMKMFPGMDFTLSSGDFHDFFTALVGDLCPHAGNVADSTITFFGVPGGVAFTDKSLGAPNPSYLLCSGISSESGNGSCSDAAGVGL